MKTFFLRFLLICITAAGVAACAGTESSVYHWQGRGDIGPQKFVRDHNVCIREADAWPFDTSPYAMFDNLSPGPHDPKNRMDPENGKVLVEKVNMVTRHTKPRRQGETGGRIEGEAPLYSSKVIRICPKCGKETRIGRKVMEDGKKVRYCKKCLEMID